jgi:hypothetical protein
MRSVASAKGRSSRSLLSLSQTQTVSLFPKTKLNQVAAVDEVRREGMEEIIAA